MLVYLTNFTFLLDINIFTYGNRWQILDYLPNVPNIKTRINLAMITIPMIETCLFYSRCYSFLTKLT